MSDSQLTLTHSIQIQLDSVRQLRIQTGEIEHDRQIEVSIKIYFVHCYNLFLDTYIHPFDTTYLYTFN